MLIDFRIDTSFDLVCESCGSCVVVKFTDERNDRDVGLINIECIYLLISIQEIITNDQLLAMLKFFRRSSF